MTKNAYPHICILTTKLVILGRLRKSVFLCSECSLSYLDDTMFIRMTFLQVNIVDSGKQH